MKFATHKSGILIPKHRDIEVPTRTKIEGWYKFEAVRPDGSRRLLADWFPNLITDLGLNRYTTGTILTTCVVGSGTNAPAVTDTQLQTLVASTTTITTTTNGNTASAPYYAYAQRTYRFAEGVAAGNLSEVGVGWASTTLFSRARILDGLGSPTTITVLSNEVLDVTYEARFYPKTDADTNFNATISAVSYAFTCRPSLVTGSSWSVFNGAIPSAQATAYSGALGNVTQSPSGTASNSGASAFAAYSNNSFKRTASVVFSLTQGNLAGDVIPTIVLATVSSGVRWQLAISPSIPKDSTKTLTLNWEWSWSRTP